MVWGMGGFSINKEYLEVTASPHAQHARFLLVRHINATSAGATFTHFVGKILEEKAMGSLFDARTVIAMNA